MKTISAAVVSALLLSNAYAAGLGKLTVLSALGQPLRAEIELTSVSRDEVGALAARLASPEAYRQANIERSAALSTLRFSIVQRGDSQVINVTSPQPLNEPFVDMLLELSGPNGRLVREYTFLLDPPEMRATQPTQIAQPNTVPQRTAMDSKPSSAADAVAQAPARARPPAPAKSEPATDPNAAPGDYRIKSGDTLSHIASRMKGSGVSLDQMLVALYRANPDAFIGENMNRLRAGRILSIPNADAAQSISREEAREIVLAQSADFNAYRAKLAGQVAVADAQKAAPGKQSASGKITAKVEEPTTPDNEAKDKLKLSKPSANDVAPASKAAGVEDKIATEKAAAEANSRVKELEKNINDLQKILEVKNEGLAEQQNQAEAVAKAQEQVKPDVAPAAGTDAAAPSASTEQPSSPAPEASMPAKPKPAVPVPAPVSQPSFFDDLLENPLALPGLGVLLAGLGALGFMSARRRKQKKNFEDSIITDSSLKANSLFGSTGGQSVDTNNSVFNSSFAPSVSQLDSNEVDPVAEADVYIAYGRDAQAEEILKEALRTQPDRHAVRVKLLEIYSNRKDTRAFEILATELYGLTKGEGDEWAQAATLGRALDPSNPMYATDKPAATAGTGAGMAAAGLAPVGEGAESGEPVSSPAPLMAEAVLDEGKTESGGLDFDLDGLDFKTGETPNVAPAAAAPEASIDMTAIDLDFLDQPAEKTNAASEMVDVPKPVEDKTVESPAVQDLPAFSLDIPDAAEEVAPEAKVEPAPLEFDLSDINLELPKTDAKPDTAASVDPAMSAIHAEMATKLDLAVAYQEIGDKEGARELLDEVLKGGSPEQSEKARSLLLELA